MDNTEIPVDALKQAANMGYETATQSMAKAAIQLAKTSGHLRGDEALLIFAHCLMETNAEMFPKGAEQ
jgi:hypothetical protein